jgi:glycine betaine/choline ABC-type transport system substrate-binding protein
LQQHPELSQAIDALGGKISDQEMQKLNYALDGEHRDPKDVAHEFLESKGLVP